MRFVMTAVIGSVLLNAAFVRFGRGSFGHGLGVLALVLYSGLPLALAGTGLAFFSTSDSPARALSRWTLCIAAMIASTLVSIPIGAAVVERDIDAAKAYCESLVPRLEAHKESHGSYPRDIGLVSDPAERPELLRARSYYTSDGSTFHFTFVDPSGMMDGYAYDSNSLRWTKWD